MKAKQHFFDNSNCENACDGVEGTIKTLAARASLQMRIHNQILNPHKLYSFAKSGIPGISCFFVDKQQVDNVSNF